MKYRKWGLVPVPTESNIACGVISPYNICVSIIAGSDEDEVIETGKGIVDHLIREHYPKGALGRYPPPVRKHTPPGCPNVEFGRCRPIEAPA